MNVFVKYLPLTLALTTLPVAAHAGNMIPGAGQPATHKEVRQQAFLTDVLSTLALSRSPIAKNTLAAVQSNAIELDVMSRLSVADCQTLIAENPGQWTGVVGAAECVAGENGRAIVPKKILERVSGYQTENRIYIREDVRLAEAASTVVHETNHVANGTHHRYGSAREILEEEYRAYYTALLYTDGKAPNSGYLSWLKGWIIEQYALKGVAPVDILDRPTGILDNVLNSAPVVADSVASN